MNNYDEYEKLIRQLKEQLAKEQKHISRLKIMNKSHDETVGRLTEENNQLNRQLVKIKHKLEQELAELKEKYDERLTKTNDKLLEIIQKLNELTRRGVDYK